MDQVYRAELLRRIDAVFAAKPALMNHRQRFPWLTGALGDPGSRNWFVAENPSLSQLERVQDPKGGPPSEEAQWWSSKGDRLLRDLLVKHGFKDAPAEAHGGWRCYITNVIKEADYVERWRGSPALRQREAAVAWAPVLNWELEQSRPRLIVALGKTVARALEGLRAYGLALPEVMRIPHYSICRVTPARETGTDAS